MSDDESQLPTPAKPQLPADLSNSRELLERLIKLEEGRLARDNRQIDLQEKAIEVSNQQDERQANFHRDRITLEDGQDKRRVTLVSRTLWIGATLIAFPLALLLWMVFWGDETQRDTALVVFEATAIGVAGYGVITALGRVSRAIMSRTD